MNINTLTIKAQEAGAWGWVRLVNAAGRRDNGVRKRN